MKSYIHGTLTQRIRGISDRIGLKQILLSHTSIWPGNTYRPIRDEQGGASALLEIKSGLLATWHGRFKK
jgi:hypothetical protein